MKYPRIMMEIASKQWAINEDALRGIVKATEGIDGELERSFFHGAEEEKRETIFDVLGNPREEGNRYTSINGRVGTIMIDGPIIPRASWLGDVSGLVSIEELTQEFKLLENDSSIDEIVLFLDSPGGAITGVSEFARIVADSPKNVTAYVFGLAASAGYWIASAADRIVSSDTGIVGSIGVVQTIWIDDKDQVVEIVSRQSPDKRIDPETKAGKAKIQDLLSDLADVFIDAVAENRGVDREIVLSDFGKGDVFAALKAQKAGMIDGIADLSFFIESLKNGVVIEPPPFIDDTEEDESLAATFSADNAISGIRKIEVIVATQTEEDIIETKELEEMSIEKLINDNPDLAAHIEAERSAAFDSGKATADKRVKAATPILEGNTYPDSIRAIACQVLNGEQDSAALTGAVAAYDAVKEEIKSKEVIEEQPEDTPAQIVETASEDGKIRTAEDFDNSIKRIRAARGLTD